MTDSKLSDAIYKIAVAFVLLHADLNLGRLNCLPDWLGYLMILGILETLAEEAPSAALLRPLGQILAGWSAVVWGFGLLGHTPKEYVFHVIVSVVQLYFQFQLLTDLAAIAEKYAPRYSERILRLRTMMTVVLTGYTLYAAFDPPQWVTMIVALVYLGAALLTCKVLTELQRELAPPKSEELTFSDRVKQNADQYDQMK